jgi:hypothetical protein
MAKKKVFFFADQNIGLLEKFSYSLAGGAGGAAPRRLS